MTASEEKFEAQKDEDVEAHKRKTVNDEVTENDDDDGGDDDVEAHRRRA
jgi:hypothetical protein